METIEYKDKKNLPLNVLKACIDAPWAIMESSMKLILDVINRETDPDAVQKQIGQPLQNTRNVEVRDNVAIIPIIGPIFRYANLFTRISGATSIEDLSTDFEKAIENPNVKKIILNIDSPGGQVNGTSELANMIFEARGKKEIHSYIGSTGASAAYWIGSAAESITIADTAVAGSIGTIISIVDSKGHYERQGYTFYDFVSRKSPNKNLSPGSPEGQERILKLLDSITETFLNAVSLQRSYTKERVESDFGQGDIFTGYDAVEAGLVDSVGSFEGLLSKIITKKIYGGLNMGDEQIKDVSPAPEAKEPKENDTPITKDSVSALYPEIANSLREDGAKSERERIKGIEANSMPGYDEQLAEMKYDGKTTPEQAASKILQLEKEKQNQMKEKIKSDASKLNEISADSQPDDETSGDQNKSAISNMMAGMDSFAKKRRA